MFKIVFPHLTEKTN